MALEIRRTSQRDYTKHMKVTIAGHPGSGKGHPLTTELLTPHGWQQIGDLKEGDYVISRVDEPTKVIGVYDRGVLPTYRVSFSDGSSVLCDGDHLWNVQTRKMFYSNSGFDYCKALSVSELLQNGVLAERGGNRKPLPKYYVPLYEVDVSRSDDSPAIIGDRSAHSLIGMDPYLLGVLLANGSLSQSSAVFYTNDHDVANRLVGRTDLGDGITVKEVAPTDTCRRYAVNGINELLRKLDLKNCLSAEKFIPESAFLMAASDRMLLLQGLMDCDGSALGTRTPAYYTCSEELRDGITKLVQSLGGVATFTEDLRRAPTVDYVIKIRMPDRPFTPGTKKWHADQFDYDKKIARYITSIDRVDDQEIRCIAVDNTENLYVTEHYLVTHNTLMSSTFPNPLYATTDPRFMSIAEKNLPLFHIKSTDELFELRQALNRSAEEREKLIGEPVETLVFDTVNNFQRIMQRERLREMNRDTMVTDDWVWLGERLPTILESIVELPMNIVFIVHLYSKDIGDGGSGWFQPALSGQTARYVAECVDVSGILLATSPVGVDNKEDNYGDKPPAKITRRFITAPSERYPYVKDHSGRLPLEFPVNLKDDYERMHALIYADYEAMEEGESRTIELPDSEKVTRKPRLVKAKDRPVSAAEAKAGLQRQKTKSRVVIGEDGKKILVSVNSDKPEEQEPTEVPPVQVNTDTEDVVVSKARRSRKQVIQEENSVETKETSVEVQARVPMGLSEFEYDGIKSLNQLPEGVTPVQEHDGNVGYYCELSGRELPRPAKAEMSKLKFHGHVIHPDLWKAPEAQDLQPF